MNPRGEESLAARVARLEAGERAAEDHRVTRDREIRDIKDTVRRVEKKLDKLMDAEARRDGAIGLGKWIVGTGFLGAVGTVFFALTEWLRGHN